MGNHAQHALITFALALLITGCASTKQVPSQGVSVCDLDGEPKRFLDRETVVRAKVFNGDPHESYAFADGCDDIYLMVDVPPDAKAGTLDTLLRNRAQLGGEAIAPTLKMRARLAMRKWRLTGTTHVGTREFLEILEIVSVTPAR